MTAARPGAEPSAKFSVLVPFLPRRPEQVLPYAGLVQWTHAARLWQGQALMIEPHHSFVHPAGAGFRVPTGLGVTLMPLRHPYEAALQARSLAMATGHPVVAGYGPGAPDFQHALLGRAYGRPLTAVREYLTIVRRLLAGEAVDAVGEEFCCHAQLVPYPSPRIEVGAGVLRRGMARLAGEVADVAITWLAPASYVRDVIAPAVREGAEAAGRPVPRIAAMVPVALAADDRDPTEIVMASNARHLQAPHYQAMLRGAGIELPADDAAAMAKAVIAGGAFLLGDPDDVVAGLTEFHRAGADEVILNVVGVCNVKGPEAATAELRTLLRLVEPVATATDLGAPFVGPAREGGG